MQYLKYFLFGLLIVSTSCNNDDDNTSTDQLPPATQTGENTFGCLVNGESFVLSNTNDQVAIYQQGQLQFGGGGIFIIINEPFSINNHIDIIGKARYIENPNEQSCYYDFDDCFEGVVNFSRIDQTNFIISGIFEFSTIIEDCETVVITNGRFDMQYIP